MEKKTKISTMNELSDALGISRPTLSRFFQDPASVRPSTSAKIEERLKSVDYVPNFFATRMNRKSTGIIGVVIPYHNRRRQHRRYDSHDCVSCVITSLTIITVSLASHEVSFV